MFSFGPRNEKPESQLHMSARTGNIESVRAILKEPGVDLISQYICQISLKNFMEYLFCRLILLLYKLRYKISMLILSDYSLKNRKEAS